MYKYKKEKLELSSPVKREINKRKSVIVTLSHDFFPVN